MTASCGQCHACELGDSTHCYSCKTCGSPWCDWLGDHPQQLADAKIHAMADVALQHTYSQHFRACACGWKSELPADSPDFKHEVLVHIMADVARLAGLR